MSCLKWRHMFTSRKGTSTYIYVSQPSKQSDIKHNNNITYAFMKISVHGYVKSRYHTHNQHLPEIAHAKYHFKKVVILFAINFHMNTDVTCLPGL